MRRVAITLFAATFVALPAISHAQYNDTDRQNPKEYHDEDSQPLAIVADLLYPVGFAVEWLVARPLHYLSTDSPASPIFRPVGGDDMSPPPPVPIIPDNTMDAGVGARDAAGLVSNAGALDDECNRDQAGRPARGSTACDRAAGASLNFRFSP